MVTPDHVLGHTRLAKDRVGDVVPHDVWTAATFASKLKQYPDFPFDRHSFWTHPVAPLSGTAWSYGVKNRSYTYRQEMVVRMGSHLVRWHDSATDTAGQLSVEKDFERTKRNVSLRPLYTIPDRPGICYPYLFLSDDDGAPWRRGVAATYRLKDHPDITVWLSDANAAGRMEGETSGHQRARYNSEFFWRTDYRKYRVLTYLFNLPTRFPATRMAGYPGVESYVKLTREDGTLDYGYLVAVRGDPDAKQDEPDLMLYVIRDAAEARVRGLEPYGDEKTFLALARSIAATVKRRPVAAGTGR